MRHFFTLGTVLVAAGACGGTTIIREGQGNTQTDGGPTAGGTSATGMAGHVGQAGGNNGGSVGQGGAIIGVGGAAGIAGQTSVGECTPSFCPGSGSERGVACCVSTGGPCGIDYGMGCVNAGPLHRCATDEDCPVPPMVCVPCADGSCAPGHTRCTAGTCESGIDACPGTLHWYQTCGAPPPCRDPAPPSGVSACNPAAGEKEGGACPKDGLQCDASIGCGVLLQCRAAIPVPSCPH